MLLARAALVLVPLLLLGCAERQAQVAVQTALSSLAHGLEASDALVAEAIPQAASRARTQVLEERESDPGMTVDEAMARYEHLMGAWNQTVTALRAVRASLYVGQDAVTAWVQSGDLPASWGTFCGAIEAGVRDLLRLLEECGVEVPEIVLGIAGYSAQACEIAGPWLARTTE